MKIIITGFMGCGKTRVARELARRIDLEMTDLDERITQNEGRSPAQLIVVDGEPAFRTIESNTLRELLQKEGDAVIALGGGAWIEETNRELINQHGCLSVWLDTPFEVCWARIEASDEVRPLGKTREQAQALYDQRRPIYELASIHIQIVDDNLDELISRLRG